ncbi:MAG: hypothetical protein ACOYXC_02755 [Candidatus Rifleibacteriota bacterium]
MSEANRYSIIGIFSAILIFAIFAGNNLIASVFASFSLATIPRELRLGIEAGLIESESCNKKHLNSACTRNSFAEKLSTVIEQIGLAEMSELKALEYAGIMEKSKKKTFTRKQAIEALLRTTMLLGDKGLIKLSGEKPLNYRDYRVPEKYGKAMAMLQQKFVVRGYPDGMIGAERRLTNREAVFFLYRLYEMAATEMMANRSEKGIRFIDLALNHPVMDSIKILTDAGAFDKIQLKPAFDGDSLVSVNDMTGMIEGIMGRNQQTIDQIRIKTIFAAENQVNRGQLALILEYLIPVSELPNSGENLDYLDVQPSSPEYNALKKLQTLDVMLGYQKNLRASEKVSWFEAVSAMAKVLSLKADAVAEVKPDRLAEKSDIEALMAVIKAKKARIRQILDYKKPYSR